MIPLQAAWDPTQKQKDALTGAQQKTMVALEKFKAIPDLAPFFDAADGYVVFPSIAKAGIGIGGPVVRARSSKMARSLVNHR